MIFTDATCGGSAVECVINGFVWCLQCGKQEGGFSAEEDKLWFHETLDASVDKSPDSSTQPSRQSSSRDKSQTGCRVCCPKLLTRVYLPSALISYLSITFLKYAHPPYLSHSGIFLRVDWSTIHSDGLRSIDTLCRHFAMSAVSHFAHFYYESIVKGNPICCDCPLHSGSDLSFSSMLLMHRVIRKLWMDRPTFRQPAGE